MPEGVSKEDAQAEATDRFNEINLLLSNLANNFSNNLMDSTAAFKRLITDKAGMAGLPDSFLGQAAQQVGFSERPPPSPVHAVYGSAVMSSPGNQGLHHSRATASSKRGRMGIWFAVTSVLWVDAGCDRRLCQCYRREWAMDAGSGSAIICSSRHLC